MASAPPRQRRTTLDQRSSRLRSWKGRQTCRPPRRHVPLRPEYGRRASPRCPASDQDSHAPEPISPFSRPHLWGRKHAKEVRRKPLMACQNSRPTTSPVAGSIPAGPNRAPCWLPARHVATVVLALCSVPSRFTPMRTAGLSSAFKRGGPHHCRSRVTLATQQGNATLRPRAGLARTR